MMLETTRVRKVLITRSREGNRELGERLRSAGFEPICADLLSFREPEDWSEVDDRLHRLRSYDWVVLTSAIGAKVFAERMRTLGLSQGETTRTRVAVVGSKTAEALSAEGWRVDFVPTRFVTEALGEQIPGGGSVLLLRTDIAGLALRRTLERRQFAVDELVLYRTVREAPRESRLFAEADLVMFGSPSAVESLCSQVPESVMARLVEKEAACIGPVTAAAARAHGFTRVVHPAESYTFDSLIQEMRALHGLA